MIEESNIQKYKKKALFVLLFSSLFILALFVILDQFQITDIQTEIRSANPLLLIFSFLTMSLAFFGMGLRWRALMPVHPPLFSLTGIICAGLLLNYATPGPLGEVAASYFAAKKYDLRFSQALTSNVVARLIGLISAAVIGSIVWLCFPLSIAPTLILPIQSIAIFSLILGLFLISLFIYPSFWTELTKPNPSPTENPTFLKKIWSSGKNAIHQLCLDARSLSHSPTSSYPQAIFWSCFSHASVVISIILLAISIHADVSILGIIFTYAVTTAGAVLLFALPGSYIGWDALFLGLLLSTAELTQTQSIAIVGIVRLQQLSYMLLGAFSLHWLLQTSTSSTIRNQP